MEERARTCCFTGHREIAPAQLAPLQAVLEAAVRQAAEEGFCSFLCGGARGFDLLAAETVLALKPQLPQLRLIMALPCAEQTRGWPAAEQRRHARILRLADETVCLSPTYTPWCMLARDRYMVDRSARCISYLTRFQGGTGYTVKYALQQGVEVINLALQCKID